MKESQAKTQNYEISYLRFLNNTLQIKELREDICDEFTRKIFDYLEVEPLFDAQVFCALLDHFIHKCYRYKAVVMRPINPIDRIRLGYLPQELFLFLDLPTNRFALSSVNANYFHSVSLEDKLKHLLHSDEPSWKKPCVKIIPPEVSGNADFITYVDLEFTLPRLTLEQKLDILHFTICALNYLSQKDEPIETFSDPTISSAVIVSKPKDLKVISEILIQVRDSVISNTLNEKEGFGDDLEFDESLPDIARILKAQKQDPQIEKRWLNLDKQRENEQNSRQRLLDRLKNEPLNIRPRPNPFYVGGEAWYEPGTIPEKKKTQGYPPHLLQQIIDTAARLYEEKDKVRAIDIYTELGIEKNTYNKRIRYFGYDTPKILDEARAKFRESQSSKK